MRFQTIMPTLVIYFIIVKELLLFFKYTENVLFFNKIRSLPARCSYRHLEIKNTKQITIMELPVCPPRT